MDRFVLPGFSGDDAQDLHTYICTDCTLAYLYDNMIDADVAHKRDNADCRGIIVLEENFKPKHTTSEVEHPSHYTFGRFEVIDVLEDWFPADPLLWQVGKYISRAGRKDSLVTDLEKAKWYLERRIAKAKEIK